MAEREMMMEVGESSPWFNEPINNWNDNSTMFANAQL